MRKPYTELVDFIIELMGKEPLKGSADLVADQSGVGRPVVDLFRKAGVPLQGASITAGEIQTEARPGEFRVAKKLLISNLEARMQLQGADGGPPSPRARDPEGRDEDLQEDDERGGPHGVRRALGQARRSDHVGGARPLVADAAAAGRPHGQNLDMTPEFTPGELGASWRGRGRSGSTP
jgi:hypothetical protein